MSELARGLNRAPRLLERKHDEEMSRAQADEEGDPAGDVDASNHSGGSKTKWFVNRSSNRKSSAPLLGDTQSGSLARLWRPLGILPRRGKDRSDLMDLVDELQMGQDDDAVNAMINVATRYG